MYRMRDSGDSITGEEGKAVQKSKHANKNNSATKTSTTSPNYFPATQQPKTTQHTLLNSHSPQHHLHYHPSQTPSYSPGPIRQRETQHHNHYHHRRLGNELSRPDKFSTLSTFVKTP